MLLNWFLADLQGTNANLPIKLGFGLYERAQRQKISIKSRGERASSANGENIPTVHKFAVLVYIVVRNYGS